ncbi:MAG: methylisocitrate lyase [Fimbriimonadaceae bacterium]|nr:methylisocitrate lyase [Fimbriimonadaceae bacterium]
MLRPPLSNPGRVLRGLMSQGTVVVPGVYDAITARLAERAGFSAAYLSGGALTNSRLGAPDIALLTQDEMVGTAARCCQAAHIPILADADTGFGDVWNVTRTVLAAEAAGLAGIHIEDQQMPKRCGHLDGKAIVPTAEMSQKIRAGVEAKARPDFMLIARTDARSVEGLEAAIERGKAFVDAGADAVFPEGLESEHEFETFRAAVPGPLLANMTEFGKTLLIPATAFESIGYEMVIFPVTALRVAVKAVADWYSFLAANGTQEGFLDRMVTRKELYDVVGYEEYEKSDAAWSGL